MRDRYGLAPAIALGMRAVSMPVSADAAVAGLIQPGDRVDILGTFALPARNGVPGELENVTLTVLQDVSVLATGQQLAKAEFGGRMGRTRSYSTVTFEVTPREAELLVFAQTVEGELTLTLRNPEDQSFEKEVPEINFEQLESSLPGLNLYRQKEIRHKPDL
jgi:pilus assembly protein CpaB